MTKKHLLKSLIFCSICSIGITASYADYSDISTIKLINAHQKSSSIKTINNSSGSNTSSEIKVDLSPSGHISYEGVSLPLESYELNITNATDKFVQRNIRAAWEDFKTTINTATQNDFFHLILGNKMAELGFFDLADLSIAEVNDKEFVEISKTSIKKFYYPAKTIKVEDELFLAQIYSDIAFNNQSLEATNELLKKESLSNCDYANYLLSLGFYKSGNYANAIKFINKAISQNPSNLNYLVLKAKECADHNKSDEAIRIVNNLKKVNIKSYEYQNKIAALEQLISYKTKKSLWEKHYHLGLYYYIENDYSKAIKSLQIALSDKKHVQKAKIYGLMSEIYFSMQDYDKATETSQKAYKADSFQYDTLITLGDLEYKNKNYNRALNFYRKACGRDKKDYKASIRLANTYIKMSNSKKSKEIFTKIVKANPYNWEAYYNLALLDNVFAEKYLRKSLAINPLYANAWAELAKIEINTKNYDLAKKYLASAYYIDENCFKYYYYQGLLCKNMGDNAQAKFNFKKCLKIDPNNPNAQTELDNILRKEGIQDSI